MYEHLSPILHNLQWCGKVNRNTIIALNSYTKFEKHSQQKQWASDSKGKQSCYNFVMRLDNNDRGAVRENSAPAERTGVANEKHSRNSGTNPFSRKQVTNTNSHWRTQKWQQEIPARGRGRRVKRGGGLASAIREEIEELKWQERTGIIPELTERKLLLEEKLEKAGFYPSL